MSENIKPTGPGGAKESGPSKKEGPAGSDFKKFYVEKVEEVPEELKGKKKRKGVPGEDDEEEGISSPQKEVAPFSTETSPKKGSILDVQKGGTPQPTETPEEAPETPPTIFSYTPSGQVTPETEEDLEIPQPPEPPPQEIPPPIPQTPPPPPPFIDEPEDTEFGEEVDLIPPNLDNETSEQPLNQETQRQEPTVSEGTTTPAPTKPAAEASDKFFKELGSKKVGKTEGKEKIKEETPLSGTKEKKSVKGTKGEIRKEATSHKEAAKVEKKGSIEQPLEGAPFTPMVVMGGAIPESPTPTQPFLSKNAEQLMMQMIGRISYMQEKSITGDEHTTKIDLSNPAFANSVFYNTVVEIKEYSTARGQFQIEILFDTNEAQKLAEKNVASLIAAFQAPEYMKKNISVNITTGRRPLNEGVRRIPKEKKDRDQQNR